ncbi:exodeoxyribonuclease VII small subunit [Thermophilibacter immobilis]|jgi:hypothetical protein|uniref:Exodeoxyribonuclease VII small subunit n=1 Tax=Thermophilibacter immobilis TaxID=2779519 RepID=A0A7S7M793_9ACTN|nr:exodeoxyribonuclease VII small subunit [Thermophilibacter immobilis]QOY60081.1 exodeoxyribonuclease VII small subunit [Thermophilibacter immobilis]
MGRVDVSRYQTFGEISERLDGIVGQVRDKDVSLERSLDLFDEAIALGSKAVGLVDATDFSPEEEARLVQEAPHAPDGGDASGAGSNDAQD